MVEYLDSEAGTHQSPTYCSMEPYADKTNARTAMGHLGAINNGLYFGCVGKSSFAGRFLKCALLSFVIPVAGFSQTGAATVSGAAGPNQPGGSGKNEDFVGIDSG